MIYFMRVLALSHNRVIVGLISQDLNGCRTIRLLTAGLYDGIQLGHLKLFINSAFTITISFLYLFNTHRKWDATKQMQMKIYLASLQFLDDCHPSVKAIIRSSLHNK